MALEARLDVVPAYISSLISFSPALLSRGVGFVMAPWCWAFCTFCLDSSSFSWLFRLRPGVFFPGKMS